MSAVHNWAFTFPVRNEVTGSSLSKGACRTPSDSRWQNAAQSTHAGAAYSAACIQRRELLTHPSVIALMGKVAPSVGYGPRVLVAALGAVAPSRLGWLGLLGCDVGSTDGDGVDARARSPQPCLGVVRCLRDAVSAVSRLADCCGSGLIDGSGALGECTVCAPLPRRIW
jgi:hypothetical protein